MSLEQGSLLADAARPAVARVFFALWPDALVRSQLRQFGLSIQRQLGGRATQAERLHLTLVFLGNIPLGMLDQLKLPLAINPPRTFAVGLDDWGCWPHNQVAWVAPSRVPPPLLDLVNVLEDWMRVLRIKLPGRNFVPHITVLRKARCAALAETMPPLTWQVREFVLVHSHLEPPHSRYELIGRWPLAA